MVTCTTDADTSLIEELRGSGRITQQGLERARHAAAETGARLPEVLVSLGLVPEDALAAALSRAGGWPLLATEDWPDERVGDLSPRWLEQARVVPLRVRDGEVVVAMADPGDVYARRAVELAFGMPAAPVVAPASEIRKLLARLSQDAADAADTVIAAADDDVQRLKDLASEAPVIRYVNQIIARAVEERATDIHVEAHAAGSLARLRIDGVLHDVEPPPPALVRAIVSRIKILSGLDIAERRLPQDGAIRMTVAGRPIDLRVSTTPTQHGESVVLRVLDQNAVSLDFATLGFEGRDLELWLAALARPNGMLLVTGPTSHGKTTTLYSSLAHINHPGRKLFTVEDPIEYDLTRVNQIQVKPAIGLTFASVLRSLLRQNPDVVMVGEMRDRETVQIGIEFALTGVLVLSTLHTRNAPGAVTRMLERGIEDYLISATLGAVLAQRLVRTLCPDCKEPDPASDALVERLGLAGMARPGQVLFRARGCPRCRNTGWRGRTMISELMVMSDDLRQALLTRHDANRLAEVARAEGMTTLFEAGMAKALSGNTTPDEVLRVTLEGG